MRNGNNRFKPTQAAGGRALVLAAAIAACLPAHSMAAPQKTQAESVVTFSIPSGNLATALDTFSSQSGKQLLYRQELVAGKKSSAISGALTPTAALDAILRRTSLVWEHVNNSTIVIKAALPRTAEPAPKSAAKSAPPNASPSDDEIKALSEVLVIGSRSLNADVVRSRSDIQPYVVFEREDIANSMAGNVEEFLSARLPMNQTAGPAARSIAPSGDVGNRSQFNLRGLGVNQTLILINGRRAPGVSRVNASGDLGQPDINGIPLAAIDRIEVLPATASGIYGGSATGGVINVILRNDYEGSTLRLAYDNTFDTNSARVTADFSTMLSLEEGKTRLNFSASRSKASSLLEQDRNFASKARRLALRNAPDLVYLYGNPLRSALTNISTLDGTNLTLRDGTDLGARITHVPQGYAGWQSDGGRGLANGAGTYDLSIPNTTFGGLHSLSQAPTTTSSYLTVKRDFSEALSAYLDLSATRNESVAQTGGGGGAWLFPDDPGNPFNNVVIVSFPVGDVPVPRYVASNTYGANGGLIYRLNDRWTFGLDLRWNRSTNENDYRSFFYDPFAMSEAARSGAFDVFKDLSQSPPELAQYEIVDRYIFGPAAGYNKEAAARLSGRFWRLPGGDATLTAVVSRRRESTGDVLFDLGGYGYYQYHPSRSQVVDSLYAETAFPLVSEQQEIPLLHKFDLQVSARRDRYTTNSVPPGLSIILDNPDGPIPPYEMGRNSVASNDYTVGFRYMPYADLALRASIGTGFLPPSLSQVASSDTATMLYVIDPKRGGDYQLYHPVNVAFAGGTENLRAEQSRSLSVGAIYAPGNSGFRLSLDYTRIEKSDEIAGLDPQTLLYLEDRFPGRVERGGRLPGDPESWAGVITRMDASLLNIAESEVEAFDLQVDADWELGSYGWLRARGVVTRQTRLSRRVLTDTPMIDSVGFSDGPLEWRGSAGLEWDYGDFSVELNAQYYDSYKVYSADSTASSIDYAVRLQGASKIPSQTYFDAAFDYQVQRGWFAGTKLIVGIKNVFNRSPPILASTAAFGSYSTYGDPRMRSYYLSVEKTF